MPPPDVRRAAPRETGAYRTADDRWSRTRRGRSRLGEPGDDRVPTRVLRPSLEVRRTAAHQPGMRRHRRRLLAAHADAQLYGAPGPPQQIVQNRRSLEAGAVPRAGEIAEQPIHPARQRRVVEAGLGLPGGAPAQPGREPRERDEIQQRRHDQRRRRRPQTPAQRKASTLPPASGASRSAVRHVSRNWRTLSSACSGVTSYRSSSTFTSSATVLGDSSAWSNANPLSLTEK